MIKKGRFSWNQPPKKQMLIMNLIAPILLSVFLNVSAYGYSQHINLQIKNASFNDVFDNLKKQSGYYFVYTNEIARNSEKFNLNIRNSSLKEVLDSLLNSLSLSYQYDGNFIIIKNNPPSFTSALLPPLKGIITNVQGTPLSGINITVKGKSIGTTTDENGQFNITAAIGEVLIISGIGYESQEIRLSNVTSLNIELKEESTELSQVIVSGYTTQSKKDFTGSAVKINAAQIENRPIQSFEQALVGQAPGVNLIQPNGVLGNTPVFRIRGINSISLSSYPLIIIDGVAAFTGNFGTKAANNPLADINPSDIESVDILKDASATALYGSRAANGVLVITTKKGKKGQGKVKLDSWMGFSNAVNLPKLLNAEQYVMIKNEGLSNLGQAPGFFLETRPDGSIVETNWYDYGYQTAFSHNHNLSFSGASDNTSYYVSAGYSDHDGIIRTNSFERKSLKLSLDQKVFDRVHIGTNFTYSNSINRSPSTGSLPSQSFQIDGVARAVMMLGPNVSPFNEDGSYNMRGPNIGNGANLIGSAYYNQVAIIENDYFISENNTTISNVYGEIEIAKGLKAKTSYSINKVATENIQFYSPLQGIGFNNNGVAANMYSADTRTDWISTLTYNRSFNKSHNLNVLLGYEEIKTTVKQWGAERLDLTDPYYTNYQGGYSTIYPLGNISTLNGLISYFSNVFYDYDKKYLLSFSLRRDGYSGLSQGNKYGNFAGGSIGWNISEENFYKNSSFSNIVNNLKIRASYGSVGNVNLGDFPALSLYATGLYGDIPSLYSSQVGNPHLKWETSTKTDIGLDFSLFNNKITIQADYYKNNINDMILNAKQAPSRGIPGNSISSNVGSMYNQGFEFNITGHIIDKKDFTWTANFNISTLKNEVTQLANNNSDILGNSNSTTGAVELASITRVGHAVGSIFAVRTLGVNPDNGQRMYLNRNDEVVQYNHNGVQWTYLDGTIAAPLDIVRDGVVLGSALPSFFGGFNNSFTYKNFDVDLGFTFSGGNKMYWGNGATLLDGRYHNNSTDILRRWQKSGDVTDIPKVVYGDNTSNGGSLSHSGNLRNGNYAKLRNASIGYRFPASLASKLHLSSLRVYAQGTNLLIFTSYPGSDPEVSVNGNDSSAPGADKHSAPSARTFTFGINVGF